MTVIDEISYSEYKDLEIRELTQKARDLFENELIKTL
jgi:hypothetical protein